MDLQGKVALVTGGTMGIGAAIAIELARRGADVAIAARNLGDPAEAGRAAVESSAAAACSSPPTSLGRKTAPRPSKKRPQHFGRLDVLVHNAGGPSPGKIEEITPEQWRQTMDLHVNANFYLAKAALPHLRSTRRAAIITVSSTAGIRGVPGAIAYATAKGAIPQFTRQPGPRPGRRQHPRQLRRPRRHPHAVPRRHDGRAQGAEPEAPHPVAPRGHAASKWPRSSRCSSPTTTSPARRLSSTAA